MKKRLKGLISLWLVVAMVVGMMIMPAMAASVKVKVYTGENLLNSQTYVGNEEYTEKDVVLNTPLNEQNLANISDGSITGWNIWGMNDSGYLKSSSKNLAATGVLTLEKIEEIASDEDYYKQLLLEPLAGNYIGVTGVTLNKTELSMKEGSTETLKATVMPSNATNQEVEWYSTDEDVATVDEDGVVTAKSVGMTTIYVYSTEDYNYYAECNVTVVEGTGVWIGDVEVPDVGYYKYEDDYESEEYGLHPATENDYNVYLTGNLVDGYTLRIQDLKVENTYRPAIMSMVANLALEIQGENNELVGADGIMSAGIFAMKDLTITGSGKLNVAGGNARGAEYALRRSGEMTWGSSFGICSFGNLTISGGKITALGGESAWGGNSYGIGASGNITISSGTVTVSGGVAQGGTSYGIGAEGDITISDGTVTATGGVAYGGNSYGIGAGSNLTISGGIVTAKGSGAEAYGSAAVYDMESEENYTDIQTEGNSFGLGAVNMVTINGGVVTSTGDIAYGGNSYGIGSTGGITIRGGEVTATGDKAYGGSGAQLLSSGSSNSLQTEGNSFGMATIGVIIITGGEVTATGSDTAVSSIGIFSYIPDPANKALNLGQVTISGGEVNATGNKASQVVSFGIASGTVTITGGKVAATGGTAAGGASSVYQGNSYGIGAAVKIVIIGNAQVVVVGGTSENGSSFGLGASESVTIGNSAKLTASGGNAANGSSNGVGAMKGIFINDSATVNATAGNASNNGSIGLGSKTVVVISGGATITAQGDNWAVGAVNGITILPGNYLLYANDVQVILENLNWPTTYRFKMEQVPVYDDYEPEYRIEIKEGIEDGTVTTRVKYAAAGNTVGITVVPDEGCELDALIVTDSKGNEIEVTYKYGKYIFEMPASKVYIDAVFAADLEIPFLDVTVDDWYFDAVKYVYDNNIMAGTGATTFAPDTELSRAMVAQVLYNLDVDSYADAPDIFSDVVVGEWYVDAINWAAAEGVVAGYGNGLFGTMDSVTREQLAVILYNYAVSKDYTISGSAVLGMYADADMISNWAVGAVEWAVANGILLPENGLLTATATASRAEVALALMNFCEKCVK